MFWHPRFSYRCPKTVICACAAGWCSVMSEGCTGCGPGGYWVGYGTGVGTGRGNTGTPSTVLSGGDTSEAGPGRLLQGAWSGWVSLQRPLCAQSPEPTLRARSVRPACPPWFWALLSGSWPIRAELHLISCKVSQNRGVSPEYVEKAYHSPYFQKRSQKSPLGFLRFPFRPAFSHKE